MCLFLHIRNRKFFITISSAGRIRCEIIEMMEWHGHLLKNLFVNEKKLFFPIRNKRKTFIQKSVILYRFGIILGVPLYWNNEVKRVKKLFATHAISRGASSHKAADHALSRRCYQVCKWNRIAVTANWRVIFRLATKKGINFGCSGNGQLKFSTCKDRVKILMPVCRF